MGGNTSRWFRSSEARLEPDGRKAETPSSYLFLARSCVLNRFTDMLRGAPAEVFPTIDSHYDFVPGHKKGAAVTAALFISLLLDFCRSIAVSLASLSGLSRNKVFEFHAEHRCLLGNSSSELCDSRAASPSPFAE